MNSKTTYYIGIAVVIAAILVGRVALRGGGTNPVTGSSGQGASGGGNKETTLGDKLSTYVECLNDHGHTMIARSMENYGRWLEQNKATGGPTETMSGSPAIQVPAEYSIQNCQKAIANANAMKPSLPDLESKASAYLKSFEAVIAVEAEADKYYQRGDYKDDKFAKGKELHGKLTGAWKAYDDAGEALRAVYGPLKAEEEKKELAELEKKGPQTVYRAQHAIFAARELFKSFRNVDSPERLFAVDPAPVQAGAEDICKDADAFEAAMKSEPEEVKGDPLHSMHRKNVKDSIATLCVEAKAVARRIRDKTPFLATELAVMQSSPEHVSGTPAKVLGSLNKLVDDYNKM